MRHNGNCETHSIVLSLRASPLEAKILEKRFNAGFQLYRAAVRDGLKRLSLMRESHGWKMARLMPKTTGEQIAARNESLNSCREQYGLTENGYRERATSGRNNSKWIIDHIDSQTASNLGERAWKGMEKHLFKEGGKPKYPRMHDFNSMDGTTRGTNGIWQSITLKGQLYPDPKAGTIPSRGILNWQGPLTMAWNAKLGTSRILSIPVDIKDDTNTGHARQRQEYALGDPSTWRMMRITRQQEVVGHRPCWKYSVSLIVTLPPWHPLDRYANSPGHHVGIDLGVSSLASVSVDESGVVSALLSSETREERIERRKRAKKERELSHKIDRSTRANNPDAFYPGKLNKDGKRRKRRGQPKPGIKFKKSKTYTIYRARQANDRRKKAEERERRINLLATEIVVNQGKNIVTENVLPSQWFHLWGGSVGRFAPTKLMKAIEQGAKKSGGTYTTVNTQTTALSQSCLCGVRKRKLLSNRVHECDCGLVGMPVQRDLWSAFLATCVKKTEITSVGKDNENSASTVVKMVDTLDESLARALWAGREGAGLCLQMASSKVNETRQNTASVSIGDGRVAIMLKGTVNPLNDVTSGSAIVLTGEGQGKTGKPRSRNQTNQQETDVGTSNVTRLKRS